MVAHPYRTGLILTVLLATLNLTAATAEQLNATQDDFALMLPDGWKINLTWRDAAASILNIQGKDFGIDATFYVIHLDNHPDRTSTQIVESFQEIEVVSGLKPTPTPQVSSAHPTCPLTLTNMQSETGRVFFLSCQHPTAALLYLWRLEVPAPLLPQGDGLALNLTRFIIANFVLMDPATGQPMGPVPPGFSLPSPLEPPALDVPTAPDAPTAPTAPTAPNAPPDAGP
jgi:hypothetical protein